MRITFGAVLGLGLLAGFALGQAKPAKDTPPKGGVTRETPGGTGVKGAGKQEDKNKNKERVDGKSLDDWIKEMKHPDASKRSLAVLAILQFKDASRAVPHIVNLLHDPDVSPRAKACLALRNIGVLGKDVDAVVKGLAQRLYPGRESQAIIRYEAAVTLGRFAEDAGPAIPALAGFPPTGQGFVHSGVLDTASWEIRHVCVELLWRAGRDGENGPDPTAVKGLIRALNKEGETYDVRVATLQGLALMGKPDDPKLTEWVITELTKFSLSQNKVYALWALAGLVTKYPDGPASEDALNKLARFTGPKDPLGRPRPMELRSQAAHALGALGPRAKSRVPLLLGLLKDTEPVLVKGGCLALSHIGEKSDKVVDALITTVDHKDHNCRIWAIKALLDLQVKDARFKKALEAIHKDGTLNENLRGWAKFGIDEVAKPVVKKDADKPNR